MNEWEKYAHKAIAHSETGQIELAKEHFYKALSLSPTETWPYFKLSEILDDLDEAIYWIEKSRSVGFSEWYHFSLIKLYEKKADKISDHLIKLKKEFSSTDKGKITNPLIHCFLELNQNTDRLFGDISHYCSHSDIRGFKNKLESIALLVTGSEISNGYYERITKQLLTTINKDIARNLAFYVIVNKRNFELYLNSSIRNLKDDYRSFEILYIDIPEHLDVYITESSFKDINSIPTYGYKSGPNFIFCEAIKKLSIYNTTLFLECDCFLSQNWMTQIYDYCNSQQFLISGSQYDGYNPQKYSSLLNSHINGGTGLYATANKTFQGFARFCEDLLPLYVKYYEPDLPYDYLLKLIMEHHFDRETNPANKKIWTYLKKHYLFTSLILNYSSTSIDDTSLRLDEINRHYEYAILHKKQS